MTLQGQVTRVPPDQALHAAVFLTQKLSLMKSEWLPERETKPNQTKPGQLKPWLD